MICFMDMAFCDNAEDCKNRVGCARWFSPEQREAAKKWWGGDHAPVCFMNFIDDCDKWEPVK